ncbi:response regulator [Novosphingobium sp. SG919]|uniref:response regulator n=1 Tax=unclassified Novosphingobium TaxID=2644732 RepID=UPI0017C49C0A|nr:signal transduction histidine kinase/CheY-like chemotaxis protein [Novosphingobium sp. SG919]NMN87385.1 signal transduction histidine kinase/CheY-like chemotaxis protein [Novosphingobium sp. SG916]
MTQAPVEMLSRAELESEVQRLRHAGSAADNAVDTADARRQALFEAIDDGFCIIEFFDGPHGPLSDYRHVEANSGYERHTGIAGIVGKTLRDIAPNEADGWLELYGRVLRTGEPVRFEREFITAGRFIEVSARRVGPQGNRQVSVLFRDISERKASESALRQSEALARDNVQRVQLALSAGAILGTWIWDLPSGLVSVDEGFANAFGVEPGADLAALRVERLLGAIHADDRAGVDGAIAACLAQPGPYRHQYRVRGRHGRHAWVEAVGRVEADARGAAVRFPGVLLDLETRRAVEAERDRVTEELRRLTETLEQRVADRTAELMHAEAQLRQAQKMEAVGQLTGGLAHDFNNLLAGISGALEMIGSRLAQGRFAEVEKYLAMAQSAGRRAAALTHRLLAFSRRQTLDPRPTNVNDLVDGMADLVRRTVGPAIAVEAVGAAGLWTALVDASQLENALLNLCLNARDAMPDGGRITIETANRWFDERAAASHEIPPGQYLSLSVTDTGVGMSADVIAKAFDPFFTTKPLGQGTGLGLSMIYGFARQSGGHARIYSEVGSGTTVRIYLPRHYGSDETAHDTISAFAGAANASAAPGQGIVLVVDDEPLVRMLVVTALEDMGHTVLEAEDGAQGLKILQSEAAIDLVVTDVGLPGGMNGRQMADAARGHRPDTPVLFITGYAENAIIGNGHLEPGMQILTKPFAVGDLEQRVRAMLMGR